MKTTGKNKRHFMEPLVKHFRFTTMSSKQFTNEIVPTRILEIKEVQQIQSTFCKGSDSKLASMLPYKTTPRQNSSQIHNSEETLNQNADHLSVQSQPSSHSDLRVPKIQSDSAVIAPNLSARLTATKK